MARRRYNAEEIAEPLGLLKGAAERVGHAFSGSWQGYHTFAW